MAPLTDNELVDAVLRIRLADPAKDTAKAVHEALIAEGHADLSGSAVKKACSKAMKKKAAEEEATTVAEAKAPPKQLEEKAAAAPAPILSKKEEKAAKAAKSAMQAAEAHMMDKNRLLRIAEGDDEYSAVVATSDRGERFIQSVTARALEAKLVVAAGGATNALVSARVDADLSVLEWAILAEKGGTLKLPPEARGTALLQIERLKGVRGATTVDEVKHCFNLVEPEPEDTGTGASGPGMEYARKADGRGESHSIDRMLAKSGALAKSVLDDDEVD